MRTVTVNDGFAEWRTKARVLLAEGVTPDQVLWEEQGSEGLFSGEDEATAATMHAKPPTVPRRFMKLAQTASHHASPERWGLLYRLAWRMTLGGERDRRRIASNPDVVHKMHAFVRFKKLGEDPATGRERFVAWFEPDHRIMPLAAPFFRKRFTGMDWMILTPTGSAQWDGRTLQLGPGLKSMEPPDDVELEDLWRSYYKSIFNPARVKVKAMQAEMPKKFWKNLPEAELIDRLVAGGGRRVAGWLNEDPLPTRELENNPYLRRLKERNQAAGQSTRPGDHLGEPLPALREAAAACRACPLHEHATATVFGEGPEDARIMIVGEQPGDQEDLSGRVFVGPAGQLLEKALAEAGIDREAAYQTNAVKHFKWRREGKWRLHQKPSVDEVSKCRPWLLAELLRVRPQVLICLGSTAARSLIDPGFRILEERGTIDRPDLAARVIATVHPAWLLRRGEQVRRDDWRDFVQDLRLAAVNAGIS
jgi:DNA polymerase